AFRSCPRARRIPSLAEECERECASCFSRHGVRRPRGDPESAVRRPVRYAGSGVCRASQRERRRREYRRLMTWGSPWDVSLIFSPGQRHEIEEKHHRATLREDEGVEGEPPSRVDLDAGVAVIHIAVPRAEAEPAADSAEA